MLALDSPQWAEFKVYFGVPEELPGNLRAWQQALGTPDEEGRWDQLRDQFLCQGTITDAAVAMVPHICGSLSGATVRLWPTYIIDLGQVHAAWRYAPMTALPAESVASYEAAVVSLRPWACACLVHPWEPMEFRYLLSACAALCDHVSLGRFLFTLDSLPDEYPDLAGYV